MDSNRNKYLLSSASGFILLLLGPLSYAYTTQDKFSDDIDGNKYKTGNQQLKLTTDQLGFNGPVTLGAEYSDSFGTIFHARWAQSLGANNAIALEVAGGEEEYRINGTWGFSFDDRNMVKFSAEYLAQDMDFDFDSGTATEWVGQGAGGLTYQYLLENDFFHSLELNATYSQAENKDLDTKQFQYNGMDALNYRRIAGGKDYGASIGVNLTPFKYTLLGLQLNYDSITYDTKYEDDSDVSGLGGAIILQQILNKYVKLDLLASDRKSYGDYKGQLDMLLVNSPNNQFQVGLFGERITAGVDTDSDSRMGLNLSYAWGSEAFDPKQGYTIKAATPKTDLLNWTESPAVHMARVLAIRDQKTVNVPDPEITIPASYTADLSGGNPVNLTPFINTNGGTITGASFLDFVPAPSPHAAVQATTDYSKCNITTKVNNGRLFVVPPAKIIYASERTGGCPDSGQVLGDLNVDVTYNGGGFKSADSMIALSYAPYIDPNSLKPTITFPAETVNINGDNLTKVQLPASITSGGSALTKATLTGLPANCKIFTSVENNNIYINFPIDKVITNCGDGSFSSYVKVENSAGATATSTTQVTIAFPKAIDPVLTNVNPVSVVGKSLPTITGLTGNISSGNNGDYLTSATLTNLSSAGCNIKAQVDPKNKQNVQIIFGSDLSGCYPSGYETPNITISNQNGLSTTFNSIGISYNAAI